MTGVRRFATLENRALVLDLLEWIERSPRSYNEVMDAWRTSCPRLPVWEEAVDLGLVVRTHSKGAGATVHVTPDGRDLLRTLGRANNETMGD